MSDALETYTGFLVPVFGADFLYVLLALSVKFGDGGKEI